MREIIGRKWHLIIVIGIFGIHNLVCAQLFQTTIGSAALNDFDTSESVVQCADGSYVIAGYTSAYDAYGFDMLLIKLDPYNCVEWYKTFDATDTSTYDLAWTLIQTSDNGFLIGGYSQNAGAPKVGYLVKTDSLGNEMWQETLSAQGNRDIRELIEVEGVGYVGVGSATTSFFSQQEMYIFLVDSLGSFVGEQLFPLGISSTLHDVAQVSDNEFVAVGETRSIPGGPGHVSMLKFNLMGDIVWTKVLGKGIGYGIVNSDEHGIYIGGVATDSSYAHTDMLLINTDSDGSQNWRKTFGGDSDDGAFDIVQTLNQHIVMSGYTHSFGNGSSDLYMIKTNSQGELIWEQSMGDNQWQVGRSITLTSDFGFVTSGYYKMVEPDENYFDVYIVQTDSLGASASGIDDCTIYNTVAISESIGRGDQEFSVFPNPIINVATISIQLPVTTDMVFILYNLIGEEVRREKLVAGSNQLLRKGEAPGMYSYRLMGNGKKILGSGKLMFR